MAGIELVAHGAERKEAQLVFGEIREQPYLGKEINVLLEAQRKVGNEVQF